MQNLPDPKTVWKEDKNKHFSKNRIILILFSMVLVLSVLISAFALLGSKLNNQVNNNQNNTGNNNPAVNNSNNVTTTKAEDYEKIEAKRKEEYGEFYVPLPKESVKRYDLKDPVRGVYLSTDVAYSNFLEENIDFFAEYVKGLYAGNAANEEKVKHINDLERALALTKVSEMNTLVIDVKTDWGALAYKSNIPLAETLEANQTESYNVHLKRLLDYCYQNKIYTMARIVTFKDPHLAEKMPEHSMQLKDSGKPYIDHQGLAWVNPFDEYIWKYVVSVAKEAALYQFNEIHFDYVRFPDNAASYNPLVDFKVPKGTRKDDNIANFLKYAKEELAPYNIKTSAAIFGTTVRSFEDYPEDIGQTWRKVAEYTDRVAPMMYPSHFGPGWFGLDYPDAHPYQVMAKGMTLALEKGSMADNQAIATPWIQAFTASWVDGHIKYTPEVIAKQIQGSQSVGVDSYLLWNASGYYDPMIFNYTHENYEDDPNKDITARTVGDAVENYFNAVNDDNWARVYILTPNDLKTKDYEEFEKKKI